MKPIGRILFVALAAAFWFPEPASSCTHDPRERNCFTVEHMLDPNAVIERSDYEHQYGIVAPERGGPAHNIQISQPGSQTFPSVEVTDRTMRLVYRLSRSSHRACRPGVITFDRQDFHWEGCGMHYRLYLARNRIPTIDDFDHASPSALPDFSAPRHVRTINLDVHHTSDPPLQPGIYHAAIIGPSATAKTRFTISVRTDEMGRYRQSPPWSWQWERKEGEPELLTQPDGVTVAAHSYRDGKTEVISADNPVRQGDIVTFYGRGFENAEDVRIGIAGSWNQIEVLYFGELQAYPGYYQINVRIHPIHFLVSRNYREFRGSAWVDVRINKERERFTVPGWSTRGQDGYRIPVTHPASNPRSIELPCRWENDGWGFAELTERPGRCSAVEEAPDEAAQGGQGVSGN